MSRDELAWRGVEVGPDFHRGVRRILVCGIVFVLALRSVLSEDAADACFTPIRPNPFCCVLIAFFCVAA